ncbi:hypothetical protein COEREDRAFT_86197 [Coemansia reversa NRRL 1564]|uniref:Uncharacterized protein n=1 Tax=Coemansia reversa (strain ATCC 12441 / NRRL 1564) TaxID=763665 RepID=A0A2G5BDW7_COERN|nr:hypothetical protein COEREDRAFT_86197 [Coemansia reversa NRRL 1564]|eukprot:PIA17191.1 hypothetical protein COEREDRAFT_86197 [Coemansia reversa NRRL 1564]
MMHRMGGGGGGGGGGSAGLSSAAPVKHTPLKDIEELDNIIKKPYLVLFYTNGAERNLVQVNSSSTQQKNLKATEFRSISGEELFNPLKSKFSLFYETGILFLKNGEKMYEFDKSNSNGNIFDACLTDMHTEITLPPEILFGKKELKDYYRINMPDEPPILPSTYKALDGLSTPSSASLHQNDFEINPSNDISTPATSEAVSNIAADNEKRQEVPKQNAQCCIIL